MTKERLQRFTHKVLILHYRLNCSLVKRNALRFHAHGCMLKVMLRAEQEHASMHYWCATVGSLRATHRLIVRLYNPFSLIKDAAK